MVLHQTIVIDDSGVFTRTCEDVKSMEMSSKMPVRSSSIDEQLGYLCWPKRIILHLTSWILMPIQSRKITIKKYFNGDLYLPYVCIVSVFLDIILTIGTVQMGVGSQWDQQLSFNPCKRYEIWRFWTYTLTSKQSPQWKQWGWWFGVIIRQPFTLQAVPLETIFGPYRLMMISIIAIPACTLVTSIIYPYGSMYWQSITMFYVWFFALRICVLMNPTDFTKPRTERNRILESILFVIYTTYLLILIISCGYSPQITLMMAIIGSLFGALLGSTLINDVNSQLEPKWKRMLTKISIIILIIIMFGSFIIHLFVWNHFPKPDSNERDAQFCLNYTDNFIDNYWKQFKSPILRFNDSGHFVIISE